MNETIKPAAFIHHFRRCALLVTALYWLTPQFSQLPAVSDDSLPFNALYDSEYPHYSKGEDEVQGLSRVINCKTKAQLE